MTRDFPAGNVRVSDAERDRALAELSEHFQAGRITQDEFDERSGLALTAKTGDDLRELFTDLPDGTIVDGVHGDGAVHGDGTPRSAGSRSETPSPRAEQRPARGGRRPPIAAVVIACVIASIVIGNVASAFSQGAHQVNVGWVVPVVILLVVLRRVGRR
jgi:hypothetical protein